MTPDLLQYLCEPATYSDLILEEAEYGPDGNIWSGRLVSSSGASYPIVDGIPRFVDQQLQKSVKSFGDEWNAFDFSQWKENWLKHTVANTFGSPDVFRGKVIVDCGGGSGAQSKWFAEYGAKHVIMLELSHSVDGIVKDNLRALPNVDVVQCSIDMPPIKPGSIDGIVYCHNVIQHTPSVERTARALFALASPTGEFVFNCYPTNDHGPARWVRHHLIYRPLRAVLSRAPFPVIRGYATVMAYLRLLPLIGPVLEKMGLCSRGEVVPIPGESPAEYRSRCFDATRLNTFDKYGSHSFQHQKTDEEIKILISELQPDTSRQKNVEQYFARPSPIGCALRLSGQVR